MADIKAKHPTWFKMKIERRKLIKELPADTAVKVLLACWDYLETMEIPENLNSVEKIVFSAFFPDMEEAWKRYEQRIGAKKKGKSTDIDRYRTISVETEEETETETETDTDTKKVIYKADKPPRSRFTPPTLAEVQSYVAERHSPVDPQEFIDFYEAKGWMVGKTPMKDWKAACRNAEKWDRWSKEAGEKPKRYDPHTGTWS